MSEKYQIHIYIYGPNPSKVPMEILTILFLLSRLLKPAHFTFGRRFPTLTILLEFLLCSPDQRATIRTLNCIVIDPFS